MIGYNKIDYKKAKSIYMNPYKYACVCHVPFELAKIACLKIRHAKKEQQKNPSRCPSCNSKKIFYQFGSIEEGYGDFIECQECGETFSPDEIKNIQYLGYDPFNPLDMDIVLYFSMYYRDPAEGWRDACGAETLEEWHAFARKEILEK